MKFYTFVKSRRMKRARVIEWSCNRKEAARNNFLLLFLGKFYERSDGIISHLAAAAVAVGWLEI
jgi:hypothetical protein